MRAFSAFLFAWIVAQTFYFGSYGPDFVFIKQLRPQQMLFVLMLASFLLAKIRGVTIPTRLAAPERLLICVASVCTLSFLLSGALFDETDGKNKWLNALFNITIYPYATYFCVLAFPYSKEFARQILKVVGFLGLYLAITGIFEHYDALNALVWPSYIIDPHLGSHFGRSRGPFMESVAMGRVLTVSFAAWLLLRIESTPLMRRLAIVAILVSLASIYFTATRGPWMGLGLVFLAFFAFKTPARKTVFWLALCIASAALVGLSNKFSLLGGNLFLERQNTVTDRIVTWLVSGRMIGGHPLFGIGFGRFNAEWKNYYTNFNDFDFDGFDGSHNTLLSMAAEVGLPTLAVYLLMAFLMWRRCLRVFRQLNPSLQFERCLVVMVMGLIWMYVFTSWFSDMRWNTLQNTLVFLFLAVVAAIERDICTSVRVNRSAQESSTSLHEDKALEMPLLV